MQLYEDYYRILQVHRLAEPEVIESAYKRLARKYHPDVNRSVGSEERMKKINLAYEVLSNSEKRRQYDQQYKFDENRHQETNYHRKQDISTDIASLYAAKSALDSYFRGIIENRLDCSYELISDIDKQKFSRENFIYWQNLVSKVFHLMKYNLGLCGAKSKKMSSGQIFGKSIEFIVNVTEYNTILDMTEENSFTKLVVLENKNWKVYLGYEDLQPLIDKFKSLTGLLAAKAVIRELIEKHSRIDTLTGLLNKRGIIERMESEIQRYERYGNTFSLIMCEVHIDESVKADIRHNAEDFAVKAVGNILPSVLRSLDTVARWDKASFLILLPETDGASAIETAGRLSEKLKKEKFIYDGKVLPLSIVFRTSEYEGSLEISPDTVNLSDKYAGKRRTK